MGSNVAGMLLLALLLTVIVLLGQATIVSNTLMELTQREAAERAEERARTNFTILTTTASGSDLTVTIRNTGDTPVADFDKIDFIVKYTSGGTTVTVRLTYTTASLVANQWKKTSISPDNLEKNIRNKTETLTLDALLGGTLQSGTTGSLTISTPNGVSGTSYFVVP